jgi:hypothetical protein
VNCALRFFGISNYYHDPTAVGPVIAKLFNALLCNSGAFLFGLELNESGEDGAER